MYMVNVERDGMQHKQASLDERHPKEGEHLPKRCRHTCTHSHLTASSTERNLRYIGMYVLLHAVSVVH